jgi:predicted site-specific integrase-resolvase
MSKQINTLDGISKRYNRPEIEARRLSISRRQLSNWMRSGTVPFIQRGRVILFEPESVDSALAKFERREVTRA